MVNVNRYNEIIHRSSRLDSAHMVKVGMRSDISHSVLRYGMVFLFLCHDWYRHMYYYFISDTTQ